MIFRDRIEAAEHLLKKIPTDLVKPLVLAIPHGGFRMGEWLARELGAELDLILVSQISMPKHEFDWIGAVSELGFLETEPFADKKKLHPSELMRLMTAQVSKLQDERARITPMRTIRNPRDRDVIVVDDGMLSGCTMAAALKSIEACAPRRKIVTVGVAPINAMDRVRKYADEMIVARVLNDLKKIEACYQEKLSGRYAQPSL